MTVKQPIVGSTAKLPEHARVVIVGGGVIGCSTAYHLAKLGWKDIVLVERAQLTAGTTWHAAGLIEAGGFFSATSIGITKYTLELYKSLEVETGLATGNKNVGMITLATTLERLEEMRRIAAFDREFGVEFDEISPEKVKELWPLAYTEDLLAGFFSPGDGRVNPIDVTMALAKGARLGGVQIFEETAVTGFTTQDQRVTAVITNKGSIQADYVLQRLCVYLAGLLLYCGCERDLARLALAETGQGCHIRNKTA